MLLPSIWKKVSKIIKNIQSLTLFRPQSNNGLAHVRIAVNKKTSKGEGAVLLVEVIPF